jgi:tetratricopeptide (TPR) repeat protein
VDLGILQYQTGRPAEAEGSFQKSIDIRQKLVQEHPEVDAYHEGLAWGYMDLGAVQFGTGRPTEAASSWQDAADVREVLVVSNRNVLGYQVDLAASYTTLAAAQLAIGWSAEAEVSYRNAIAVREKLLRDHPDRADYRGDLALNYRDLANLLRAGDRMPEVVDLYHQAIAMRQQFVADDPKNPAQRASLAGDLALCGEALALMREWAESEGMYAQAVTVGSASWQTQSALALVRLAAGNEAGYRSSCADLIKQHGNDTETEAALTIALAVTAGDKALADANQPLVFAERAAQAAPTSPLATVLVGMAQYRAGNRQEAMATLTKVLAQLAATESAADANQDLLATLLGETTLVRALGEGTNRQMQEQQQAVLRESIEKVPAVATLQPGRGLPPWAVPFAVELAKHELARLDGASGERPQQP